MSSEARNSILKKIRLALTHSTPIPFPQSEAADNFFLEPPQDIIVEFAEQFTNLQGKFSFCSNEAEAGEQLRNLIDQQQWTKVYSNLDKWTQAFPQKIWTDDIVTCDAAITECAALVARTGSIVLTALNSGRITSVYAPIHICIAYTSQITYDLKDALQQLKEKYGDNLPSVVSFATGPSRTADIEKTLVVGVHGPKEVYCFLIDDTPLK